MNETLEFVLAVLVWFGGSRVIASAVALIVDVFKRFGLVKDGDAGYWSAAINLLGLAGFTAFFLLNPAVAFSGVEASLQLVMNVVLIVLAYVDQLGFSRNVHLEAVYNGIPFFFTQPSVGLFGDEDDEDLD